MCQRVPFGCGSAPVVRIRIATAILWAGPVLIRCAGARSAAVRWEVGNDLSTLGSQI
jgi:hypothetical protein